MKSGYVRKPIVLLLGSFLCSIFLLSCDVFDDNSSNVFRVSDIIPPDGAPAVSQGTTISITFSADIDGTTATDATILVTDDKGKSVSGKVSSYGVTVSFSPTDKLAKLTTYTVTIKSQLKNSRGRTLGSDYTSRFTTGDDSA
jgi:hypothetical protein